MKFDTELPLCAVKMFFSYNSAERDPTRHYMLSAEFSRTRASGILLHYMPQRIINTLMGSVLRRVRSATETRGGQPPSVIGQ